ncbi:MAG TPA: hypothetical protein VJY33_26645 [Isosphaeraceae bacterium]|nr:hypothetical protein [Isosphaeraceae bacterium]
MAEVRATLTAVDRPPRRAQLVVLATMEARHQEQWAAALGAAALVIVERLDALPASPAGEEGVSRSDGKMGPREGVREGGH